MKIIIKNANYPISYLGNIDPVVQICTLANITSESEISAIQSLYDDCVDADIWGRINIAFYPGQTKETQKYVFGQDITQLEFFSSEGNHLSSGFSPNGSAYGLFPYTPKGSISSFSCGVYYGSSEVQSGSDPRYSMGLFDNKNGAEMAIGLCRGFGGGSNTVGYMDRYSDRFANLNSSISVLKTGMLQITRENNLVRLFDSGIDISTIDRPNLPIGSGMQKIAIGAMKNTDGSFPFKSNALQKISYVGNLTLSETVIFNTIANTFLANFGRI